MNSTKFVEHGYIKLRANVDNSNNNNVVVSVEDSGPGIPLEKRNRLFAKFQDSLDLLNRGTGIGLCLCKHLSMLLNGHIYLDEAFDSGIVGSPGTRFVIELNAPALVMADYDDNNYDISEARNKYYDNCRGTAEKGEKSERTAITSSSNLFHISDAKEDPLYDLEAGGPAAELEANNTAKKEELPEKLLILFVDDDLVLRKLFKRSLLRVAPSWEVKEASNGETALQIVEELSISNQKQFDIIFLDQYMASFEKQLLGTETARALRATAQGNMTSNTIICGLSANDVEDDFIASGANAFMFKPFPCEQDSLKRELLRVLQCEKNDIRNVSSGKIIDK